MRRPDKLTAHLLDLLDPLGPVVARPMFSGIGLFHGGMMFGLIAREELFLKVGEQDQSRYRAAGEAPFSYQTKQGSHTIRSYWRCPPALLDDPETLRQWARRAVAASVAAAREKPRARRGRPAPG